MRSSSQTSRGMAMTTMKAPSVNLPMMITTRATAVTTAPTPLMTVPERQPGSRRRRWRRGMPAWARGDDNTTPTADSGVRGGVGGGRGGGAAFEGKEEEAGHRRQGQDAVGVDQPVAPLAQLAGQQGVA